MGKTSRIKKKGKGVHKRRKTVKRGGWRPKWWPFGKKEVISLAAVEPTHLIPRNPQVSESYKSQSVDLPVTPGLLKGYTINMNMRKPGQKPNEYLNMSDDSVLLHAIILKKIHDLQDKKNQQGFIDVIQEIAENKDKRIVKPENNPVLSKLFEKYRNVPKEQRKTLNELLQNPQLIETIKGDPKNIGINMDEIKDIQTNILGNIQNKENIPKVLNLLEQYDRFFEILGKDTVASDMLILDIDPRVVSEPNKFLEEIKKHSSYKENVVDFTGPAQKGYNTNEGYLNIQWTNGNLEGIDNIKIFETNNL